MLQEASMERLVPHRLCVLHWHRVSWLYEPNNFGDHLHMKILFGIRFQKVDYRFDVAGWCPPS